MSHFQTEGTHICGETRFDVPKLKYSHQLGDALVIQNMALLSHMASRRTPKTAICLYWTESGSVMRKTFRR